VFSDGGCDEQLVLPARRAIMRNHTMDSLFVGLLLADQDIDSDVVTKVLKTAGYAGFVNVRFGVIAQ
jgi:hypothetical protein